MPRISGSALLVRSADHVVLGLQWWGMTVHPGELEVGPSGGGLLITFPPQHLAEDVAPAPSSPPVTKAGSHHHHGIDTTGPDLSGATIPTGTVDVTDIPELKYVPPVKIPGLHHPGLDETGTLGPGGAEVIPTGPDAVDVTIPDLASVPMTFAEDSFDSYLVGPTVILGSTPSGPSRLAVSLDPATRVPLTVSGVLQALNGGTVVGSQFPDGTKATVVELPAGLRFAPSAADGRPIWSSTEDPVTGPNGATGLWQTRIRGRDLRLSDLDLADDFVDLDRELADPVLGPELRHTIVNASKADPDHVGPARADRIDLSSLGGSLTAHGSWRGTVWAHDAALGRDQHVRVAFSGILYPLGHRATYVEETHRVLDDDGVGAVAWLVKVATLIINEPVRDLTSTDPEIDRAFPFDTATITTTTFTGLGASVPFLYKQPAPDTAKLRADKTELEAQRADLMGDLAGPLAGYLTEPEAVARLTSYGFDPSRYWQLIAELESLGQPPDTSHDAVIQEQIREKVNKIEWIKQNYFQTPDGYSEDIQRQIADLEADVAYLYTQLSAGEPAWVAPRRAAIQDELDPMKRRVHELMNTHVDLPDLAARSDDEAGAVEARKVLDIDAQLAVIAREIERLEASSIEEHWGYHFRDAGNQPLRFPVRFETAGRPPLDVTMELMFVRDHKDPGNAFFPPFDFITGDPDKLAEHYGERSKVPVDAQTIDVVRSTSDVPTPGDLVEVHQLTVAAVAQGRSYLPQIAGLMVGLPQLRQLLGEAFAAPRAATLANDLLKHGDAAKTALTLAKELDIDFTKAADAAGGIAAPKLMATGIDRLLGPMPIEGLVPNADGKLDPLKLLDKGASMMGFELTELLGKVIGKAPKIVRDFVKQEVTFAWDVSEFKKEVGPFVAKGPSGATTRLSLLGKVNADGAVTTGTLTNFSLRFPPGNAAVVEVSFDKVEFHQEVGKTPDLKIHGIHADFLGDLQILEKVQELVDLGPSAPKINLRPSGISANYRLIVPSAKSSVFQLSNISVGVGLDIPFAPSVDDAVSLTIGFASRQSPFNLSVMMFGGGGYLEAVFDHKSMRRFELSLEFGVTAAVNFAIVSAEMQVMGGVSALVTSDHVSIVGFLRFCGSVNLLGLVSVSIQLRIELTYKGDPDNELSGHASLVIEIDLTFFSTSFQLDSGKWTLAGGDTDRSLAAAPDDDGFDVWERYRAAFEPEVASHA